MYMYMHVHACTYYITAYEAHVYMYMKTTKLAYYSCTVGLEGIASVDDKQFMQIHVRNLTCTIIHQVYNNSIHILFDDQERPCTISQEMPKPNTNIIEVKKTENRKKITQN